MKILLVSPNILTAPSPVYPIGLDYVAGAASPPHEVRIVDLNEEHGMDRLADLIRHFAPHLIGLSLRNVDDLDVFRTRSFIEGYRQIVDTLRAMTAVPIVLGGSGFTIFPSELMEALDADYGILGDGERFTLLLDALEAKSDVSRIPGILTRGRSFAGFPDNLNTTGQRYFNPDSPHLSYYLTHGGILNLQTKRGCPFKCIYCTYPHIDGSRLRLIDPDEVARTALMLQEAGAKYLFITDSTFNCSMDHSLSVARAFIKSGLTIPWGAFFAPFTPPDDYYKIMAEAGLTHVEFGTESFCDRVLSSYGKPFRMHDILKAHANADAAGLHIAHYLLFGGPGEDDNSMAETLATAEKLKNTVLILFCGIRIYPHTEIYQTALREGQITQDRNLLEPFFYQSPALPLDGVMRILKKRASGHPHWIFGSGSGKTERLMSRMHARGYIGPLWERLLSDQPDL